MSLLTICRSHTRVPHFRTESPPLSATYAHQAIADAGQSHAKARSTTPVMTWAVVILLSVLSIGILTATLGPVETLVVVIVGLTLSFFKARSKGPFRGAFYFCSYMGGALIGTAFVRCFQGKVCA